MAHDTVPRFRRLMPATAFGRLLLVFGLLALLAGGGCARRPIPAGVVKVAVLDGLTLERVVRGQELTSEGWWFGERDLLRTNNAGALATEFLARELSTVPGVAVYSPDDLRVYLATKERLIRRGFPELNPGERAELLSRQCPRDLGASLNVDYIVVPSVGWAATVRNDTTSIWTSRAELSVRVFDTQTGEVVWAWVRRDRDWFRSLAGVVEDLCRAASQAASREGAFARRPVAQGGGGS